MRYWRVPTELRLPSALFIWALSAFAASTATAQTPTATPTVGPCGLVCRFQTCTAIVFGMPVSGACYIQTDYGCECGPEGPPPTPTSTPPPTATPACAGDCNGDGSVTIDDILGMVNIALGNRPLSDCPAGDSDHDGWITVDEILAAVNSALNGCGVLPTPTPTP